MKPDQTFDDKKAFAAAVRKAGGQREPKAKGTRTVSSEPGQGDRTKALGRIAALGFMPRWRAGAGYDFWSASDPRTTTAHPTYAAAVQAAEKELSE